MKLDTIVLKLRADTTSFGDQISGSASLFRAEEETLAIPSAWVIQTAESANPNDQDQGINQLMTEFFSVLVAIDNTLDETGTQAWNTLDDLRGEIFASILGWTMDGYETAIEYISANLMSDPSRARLFYQYNFSAGKRITDEDGYVEEITTPFEKLYGLDNIVSDGEFDQVGDWTLGTGWSIGSGVASCDGSQPGDSDLEQDLTLQSVQEGKTYGIKFSVTSYTSGTLTPIIGGTSGTGVTSIGNYEEGIVWGSTDDVFRLRASSDFIGSVDHVFVLAGYGIHQDEDGEAEAEFTIDLDQ